MTEAVHIAEQQTPEDILSRSFLLDYPGEAARELESLSPKDAAEILDFQPFYAVLPVWERLVPGAVDSIFPYLSEVRRLQLLEGSDPISTAAFLSRLDQDDRDALLLKLGKDISKELKELLEYPPGSVGRTMDSKISAFHKDTKVADVLAQLKNQRPRNFGYIFLLDDNMRLCGQVDLQKLVLADSNQPLWRLSTEVRVFVSALDPMEDAVQMTKEYGIHILPVIDANNRVLGILQRSDLADALKEDLAASLQTMVGVSKDERALSGSLFAVRKRLPWLMINLLTAFLAAGVVGAFESTIAKFTALAVLLPVAAGQSGNTGAQALAVTMRGLTLREITLRHWLRVMLKECGAGFINGIAIAIVCAAGVYVWSQSYGLSLVIALAMVISMTIAATAGALVPILLRRFGQDPAQSSSIILTTVTDIAGFLSFLGIATLLSSLLEQGG